MRLILVILWGLLAVAIWPTTEGKVSRTGYGAFPTPIASEAWHYTLFHQDIIPPGSGSVTKTWTFDSDTEGWTFQDTGFPLITGAWTGADGDPSAGCLEVDAGDPSIGQGLIEWALLSLDWIALGVPSNATIDDVRLSVNVKVPTHSAGVAINFSAFMNAPGFIGLIPSTSIISDSSWTAINGTDQATSFAATTASSMALTFSGSVYPPGITFTARADTVSLYIHYTTPEVPAINEKFTSSPVVSDGGFVWALTQYTTGESYLLCVDTTGALQSHTQLLNQDTSNPVLPLYTLSTDANDRAFVVLDDCIRAFDTTGTQLWIYGDSSTFTPAWRGSCVSPSTGLVWIGNSQTGAVVMEAHSPTAGTVSFSFNTALAAAKSSTIFGMAQAGGFLYLPLDLSSNQPAIRKYSVTAVPQWTTDLSTTANGFSPGAAGVSIFNGDVHCYGLVDKVTGNDVLITLNDSDGSLKWDEQDFFLAHGTLGHDAPAVDEGSGLVFGPFGFGSATNYLRAYNGSDGSTAWTFSDSGETMAASPVPPPVIGNDGYLLLARNNLCRVKVSDGSLQAKAVGPVSPFPPALSSIYTFVTEGSAPGVLYALGPVPPPPPSPTVFGFRIGARQNPPHSVSPRNFNAYYGHPRFFGHIITPPPAVLAGLWKVYFKGFASGEDMSVGDYGLPTEFEPVLSANEVLTMQKPAVDINGFTAGKPGLIKVERDGTDPRNTDTGRQSLYLVEILYDKAQ